MKFVVKIDEVTAKKSFEDASKPLAHAISMTMDAAKRQVLEQGRAEIKHGIRGAKFANALRATRYPEKTDSMNAAVWIYHRIPYAQVFELGARIGGKPLLWLPLPTAPSRIGSLRTTPKNYIAHIGPLHFIQGRKRPLLAAYMAGPAGKVTIGKLRKGGALARLGVRSRRSNTGRQGLVSVPMFFGIPAVQLRARFNLAGVIERAAQQIPVNLNAQMMKAR